MRRRGTSAQVEVELNLSPPLRPANSPDDDVSRWSPSSSISEMSSEMSVVEGSCVSSEPEESSPETSPSMVLVGCPRCLMYVMLSQVDPKCPKCKSTVLLDFINIDEDATNTTARI